MSGNAADALSTGMRSALMGTAVRVLPLAHYTPLSKWMAVSLLTVEHLEGESF